MKKIKTLKGTSLLSDMAMELYPSALKFYGDKYKCIIDDTLNRTILYEWNKESFAEIVHDIKKINIEPDQAELVMKKEQNVNGFYIQNIKIFTGVEHYVIVKNVPNIDYMKSTLSHELFGHAVCSNYNILLEKNSNIYKRNGICLKDLNTGTITNMQTSEGMIEYIASQIMHIYNPDFKKVKNIYTYNHAVAVASIMFKYIGKDKMLELLVLGNGSIEKLFDENNTSSWKKIALELENENPDIDEYLDEFVKRYKYKNR